MELFLERSHHRVLRREHNRVAEEIAVEEGPITHPAHTDGMASRINGTVTTAGDCAAPHFPYEHDPHFPYVHRGSCRRARHARHPLMGCALGCPLGFQRLHVGMVRVGKALLA